MGAPESREAASGQPGPLSRRQPLRWRAASKASTVPAIATLRLSAEPAIGIEIRPSTRGEHRSGEPVRLVAEHERDRPGEIDART